MSSSKGSGKGNGKGPKSHSRSVLITGACGYLGSLLTSALGQNPRGVETIVAADIREPPEAMREPGVTYITLDVRSPDVTRVIQEHGIDTVVHLAAIVTPRPGDTREFLREVEVEGTRNLVEACLTGGVKKFVVTSSGAAYGYHADQDRYLTEDSPLRGNDAFAYSHHKRLVEEMLAEYRASNPELEQLILRVGTILGDSVNNQITALFDNRVVVGLQGAPTPFVFIWDRDLVRILERGVHSDASGIFNVAGDGTVTLREIARRLGKPFLPLPVDLVERSLAVLHRLRLSQYGPEQVGFLRYRPVLGNERLKRDFGYTPELTSREVFERFARSRGC